MASLYEHIRAQRLPTGSPAATDSRALPDEPEDASAPYGAPSIRWAAGARDGVAIFHVAPRAPGIRQVAPIVDALLDYLRAPNTEELRSLEQAVVRAVGDSPFVPFIHPVIDRLESVLEDDPSLARTAMEIPAATRKLLQETEQRDTLKLATAMLGAFGDPGDRELLETVGLHDEFTFYAVDSLGAIFPDATDSWMLFAVSLNGWGKIHGVLAMVEAMDALPEARREEIRRYLLRYGCENGVQNGYLALPIATHAKLSDALEGASDADLLVGAGVILSSLAEDAASGGPQGDMGEYAEGAAACERFIRALTARSETAASDRLDSFLAIASLRSFCRDVVPTDRGRWEPLGWTDACVRELTALADEFLSRPRWRDQALETLAKGDAAERWKARAVCRVLDVPMAMELELLVGADPSDVGAWHDLSAQADREGMERAAAVAPKLLRLDKLFATGPTNSLGFGPDFPRFEICDALASGLARFPGSGGEFLRKLLESPSVRNRHSALRAYEKWPQLGPADRDSVAVVAAGDPDGRVREHAEKIRLEKG